MRITQYMYSCIYMDRHRRWRKLDKNKKSNCNLIKKKERKHLRDILSLNYSHISLLKQDRLVKNE